MKSHLIEVESRLTALNAETRPPKWKAENYIGAGKSALTYLNLKIPLVRQANKSPFSFSAQPTEELWQLWDYIWQNSRIFEVMLLANYWANTRPLGERAKNHRVLLIWLNRVDNWALSDGLSSHYSRLLEHDTKRFLPIFEKWSRSQNPWFKRQSVVGLQYYARARKKSLPCSTLLKFIERQMDDDHYYVQKGVGWALRECWNVYPTATFAYLRKNAHRIAPAGWTAATEKLSPSEKRALTKQRGLKRG